MDPPTSRRGGKKACRKAFTFEKAIGLLKDRAPDIHALAVLGYEGAIDYGAHPNVKGVFGHVSIDDQDDFIAVSHTSLYGATHIETICGLCVRSPAQFELEVSRLSQQCAKPATPQAKTGDQLVDSYFFHYVASQTLQPADKAELRNRARLMVDLKLSDRKKQMLMLQWSGLNQSEIARKLDIKRQAVSKALASIPAMFHLSTEPRSQRRQPD